MKYTKLAAVALTSVMMLSACGQSANSDNPIVMTVGDTQITESEFNYYMNTYKENYNMGQAKKFHYRQQDIDRVEALLNAELARCSCFTLKQLAINGNDLKPLGYRGPELGRVLQMLLDRVMDGRLSNNREDLLAEAEKLKTN